MISLDDVLLAQERIAGHVRCTPMLAADNNFSPLVENANVMLKLELLQVTGSFKSRGATNKLLSIQSDQLQKGLVAASGGNHGLAVARAAFMAGVSATIFLPTNASPAKIEKLQRWGADIRIVGSQWHEANAAALEHVAASGAEYFHPFADPYVVAGQGTVALELLDQLPAVDLVLVAMGGGGLVSGIGTTMAALSPQTRVVGVEAAGCPLLLNALKVGRNIGLEQVKTSVPTMACAKTEDSIFQIVRDTVDEIVLVSDAEMLAAARWLWFEMGLAADHAGAAAVAALRERRVSVEAGETVCAIVCGAGPEATVSA